MRVRMCSDTGFVWGHGDDLNTMLCAVGAHCRLCTH